MKKGSLHLERDRAGEAGSLRWEVLGMLVLLMREEAGERREVG